MFARNRGKRAGAPQGSVLVPQTSARGLRPATLASNLAPLSRDETVPDHPLLLTYSTVSESVSAPLACWLLQALSGTLDG